MAAARASGMLHQREDTRATFVIDPQGMIRAMTWYAMNVGRWVDELVRLLAALQTSDRATRPWLRRGVRQPVRLQSRADKISEMLKLLGNHNSA
jgi:hypothetical protein